MPADKRPANNRFSDNPFRDPNLTPEQVAKIEERNKALRIFRETGDEGPAIAVGIFPAKPEPISLVYRGQNFTITRTRPDWATVDITLPCGHHEHDPFTIGIVEWSGQWALGRKADGGKIHRGNFKGAVRRCAYLLYRECKAIREVDSFLAESTIFCVLEGDEPKSFQQIVLEPLKLPKPTKSGPK